MGNTRLLAISIITTIIIAMFVVQQYVDVVDVPVLDDPIKVTCGNGTLSSAIKCI